VALGCWLGLALTTKYSVGLLPLLVAVMLAGAVRRGRIEGQAAAGRFALFAASLAVTAGWWFVYVEAYFNEVGQLGLVPGLLKPLLAGGADISMRRAAAAITGGIAAADVAPVAHGTLADWALTLFRTFWLTAGQRATWLSTGLVVVCLAVSIAAAAGLVMARRRRAALPWDMLGLLGLQLLLLLPFPLLRFFLTRNPAETGQGRHVLIPAAAAVGVLLTVGWVAWLPRLRPRRAMAALAGGLLAISLAGFCGTQLPAFPDRLPVRTATDAARDVPNPVHVSFGQGIELAGYQVGEVNEYGALPVDQIGRAHV
jgi:hypothetical protein